MVGVTVCASAISTNRKVGGDAALGFVSRTAIVSGGGTGATGACTAAGKDKGAVAGVGLVCNVAVELDIVPALDDSRKA